MESPGRLSASLATAPFSEQNDLWARLQERLLTWAAVECAGQCRNFSQGCRSELLAGEFTQRFIRRLTETFQGATEKLSESEQATMRAALVRLFALGRPFGHG